MAKVLVVEDDPDIQSLVEVRLRRAGYLAVGVASGQEAQEALAVLAEKGAPDVAVLDVLMPEMSGLELTAMRQDAACRATPEIFLGGKVKPGDVEAGRASGAVYLLTKPVVLSALLSAIEEALEPAATVDGSW